MATLLRRTAALPRVLLRLLVTVLLAATVTGSLTGPARAADGFRYWNYFHLEGGDTWSFSKVAGSRYEPEDGDVEGYRFGTSTTAEGIAPRTDLDEVTFEAICGGETAAPGEKRVGVVLDFGTAADADGETPPEPRAECAVVDKGASGQDVLTSVVPVRAERGFNCALDGYPAKGCGEPVKDAPKPTKEEPVAFALPTTEPTGSDAAPTGATEAPGDEGNLPWPLLGAGVLVVLIAGGAVALSRRTRVS